MPTIKRLNVNTFTTEADNDSFIAELTTLWQELDESTVHAKVSVDINKDRNNPCRMTAFLTIESEQIPEAMEEWAKTVVVPVRNKYKHDNLMIDADLVTTISK